MGVHSVTCDKKNSALASSVAHTQNCIQLEFESINVICLCARVYVCVQLLAQGAFGYLLPIISFVLAWIETWLLDFKVLPQENEDENSGLCLLPALVDSIRLPLVVSAPVLLNY